MKLYFLVLPVLLLYSTCLAQVHQKLAGKWVAKNPPQQGLNYYDIRIGEIQSPLVELNISEKITRDFIEMYALDVSEGIENFIVIKTFKSEPNIIMIERARDEAVEKFSLKDFWRYLNLKYVSREVVNDYKNCSMFISKKGGDLLLEIFKRGRKVGQQIFVRSK